jgi:hypothetical protein
MVSGGIAIADDATTSVTVGNAAPSVNTVEINSSTAITLNENTTKTVIATSTISDANGCAELSNVVADFYRSGVTAAGCDTVGEADNDSCYPRVTCAESSCSSQDATYTCTFALQYHADPTDAGAFSAQNWEMTVSAFDGTATSTGTDTEEVNTLNALNVSATIAYGTLAASATSTTQTATATNTGNAAIDAQISGTQMTSGLNSIATSSQKYGTANVFYESLANSLSATPTTLELDLAKPTTASPTITDDTFWGLLVPGGTPAGTYNGTNTFTATTD